MKPYGYYLSIERRRKLYLLLISISLIIFAQSIWQMKWVHINEIDFLGLTSHLTAAYWLGLILITACSILIYLDKNLERDWILIFVLFIIGFYLFGVSVLSEENARMPWSYYPYGEVKNLLEIGHIDTISEYPAISYRYWPLFHILSAFILIIANINVNHLPIYMPLFWVTTFIFITFSIGKKLKFDSNRSFLLAFLGLCSFWISQYYYSPQSLAVLLYLLVFMLIVAKSVSMRSEFLMLIIFSSIILTHILTPIAAMFGSIIILIRKKQKLFFLYIIIVFLCWYIYLAPTIFKLGIMKLLEQIDNHGSFSLFSTNKFSPLTFEKLVINYFRLSYLAIIAGLTLIAIVLNRKSIFNSYFLFWLIGLCGLIPLKYGPEGFERLYIFCLIPALCIVIKFLNTKLSFIFLMVLFISLHIPAHYGDECYIMTRTSELKGANFAGQNVISSLPYFYQMYPYVHYFNPMTLNVSYYTFSAYENPNVSKLYDLEIIINSAGTHNRMMYMYGEDYLQNWIEQNEQILNCLYANGEFTIARRNDI